MSTAKAAFLGAGIAETVALSFYYPYDLIKTRMQTNYSYSNILDACYKIYYQQHQT
jgi:hypothetical protein